MGIPNIQFESGPNPFEMGYGEYENLNYRGEGSIDIGILYTTKYLKTVTVYQEPDSPGSGANWEKDFDSFYDDDENKLYLQFEITIGENDGFLNMNDNYDDENEDNVKCLVCMNVNENSELNDDDYGFAACYK